MNGYLVTALNDVYMAIRVADNAIGELKDKTRSVTPFFDTLIGYEKAVKRALLSYEVIKKELDK
jgi:hypothetical protein